MPFDTTPTKVDNVELLAGYLERSETFDISQALHPCGTPACIWGHAWKLFGREPLDLKQLAVKLDLPFYNLETLCCDWGCKEAGGLDTDQITNRMAAAALRRLRDTGVAEFRLEDA